MGTLLEAVIQQAEQRFCHDSKPIIFSHQVFSVLLRPTAFTLRQVTMPDAEFYSSLGSKYEDAFGHDAGLLTFIRDALLHLPASSTVLDVGCGTGKPIASSLTAAGHRVIGIDISDTMVELSRKAVPSGSFEVADMRDYVPKERVNAVFNILSLFILSREEVEEMAGKWGNWLEVGGLLMICTLAAEDYRPLGTGAGYDADGRCARDVGFRFMGATATITLFTREGWKVLLGEKGFSIVYTSTELFVPPEEAQSDPEQHYYIIAKKVR
ncbi:hypothetical protein MMC30_005776 [Trapelia coarctata]|nr:hypothetical protein [Trapelia coarctata]